jgi:hypothetical protein
VRHNVISPFHPSTSRLSCALDPCGHRIQRQPDIPYLTMILGRVSFGEHPIGQGSGVCKKRDLPVMQFVRDEVIVSSGEDQHVLIHKFSVQILLIHLPGIFEGEGAQA